MPELIDRQALIKDMCNNKTEEKCPCYPNCYPCDYSEARRIIDIQPTIEAEPVRNGRWIPHGDYMWLCSNCKENIIFSMHESDRTEKQRYCCRCGARMDGGING